MKNLILKLKIKILYRQPLTKTSPEILYITEMLKGK